MGPSDIELAQLADLANRYDCVQKIVIDPKGGITFSLSEIAIEVVEQLDGTTIDLEKPIKIGAFDIVVFPKSLACWVYNTTKKLRYRVSDDDPFHSLWDHPFVRNGHPQGEDFLALLPPLIETRRWEELVCQTMMFLSAVKVYDKKTKSLLEIWETTTSFTNVKEKTNEK